LYNITFNAGCEVKAVITFEYINIACPANQLHFEAPWNVWMCSLQRIL